MATSLEKGKKVRVLADQKESDNEVLCRTYGKNKNDLYFHHSELTLIVKKVKQLRLNFTTELKNQKSEVPIQNRLITPTKDFPKKAKKQKQ